MCVCLRLLGGAPSPSDPNFFGPTTPKTTTNLKIPTKKRNTAVRYFQRKKKNSHTGRYFPKTSVNLINNEFSFSLKKIVLPFVCFFIVFTNQNIACGELNLKQNGNRPTLHLKSRRLKKKNRFSMGVSKHV